MLENIAQRLSRLWASVENLNGPPREFPIQRSGEGERGTGTLVLEDFHLPESKYLLYCVAMISRLWQTVK
jgi:hypothetical protein